MLTLVDNRSGVQLAAAEGNSSKTDINVWGGLFGGGAAGGAGGYTNTPEGKVLASAFADAYNNLVKAAKSYKAQEVKGRPGHRRPSGRVGRQDAGIERPVVAPRATAARSCRSRRRW